MWTLKIQQTSKYSKKETDSPVVKKKKKGGAGRIGIRN